MKKTTNSNPLKYFYDAAAARAKSVNAGNDKLIKAQVGVVAGVPSYRPASKKDLENISKIPKNFGKSVSKEDLENRQASIKNKGFNKENKRYVEFYQGHSTNPEGIPSTPSDTNYVDYMTKSDIPFKTVPKYYTDLKNKTFIQNKIGGSVKSKKK
jgi:hypothetical protein